MDTIRRDIFKAIYEGKWLAIEYRNRQHQVTRYWIGIRSLDIARRALSVDGLHLGKYSLMQYDTIYIDSILSSQIIEGSYCERNEALVEDINVNPHKYKALFGHVPNLKVLDYLEDCNRMDATPYRSDFALIPYLDRQSFCNGIYPLNDWQFRKVVQEFQFRAERMEEGPESGGFGGKAAGGMVKKRLSVQRLAMNVISIHTPRGLYVLAYRKLNLDVKAHCLRTGKDIVVCTEFTVNGARESIRRYLDGEDYGLLQDFEANQELIKDAITRAGRKGLGVDDMPYVIGLGMDIALDLRREYHAILEMYQKGQAPVPVQAFFGDLLERPRSRRAVPITPLNRQVNLDQLLAINHAMKYPVAYVQGPPGTGKTNTIINTIVTAFFNGKTMLFVSYNNHPIDGVVDKLAGLTYEGRAIPFPIVRLGNTQKVREALASMARLYESARPVLVYGEALKKNQNSQAGQMKQLSELLRKYEDILDLRERSETIRRMLEYSQGKSQSMQMLPFETDLGGRQLERVNRQLERLGEITDADALPCLWKI